MPAFHIAEINVARMKGIDINDPVMQEFVQNLDRINQLAENSPGFVWRLKDTDADVVSPNIYNDVQVIFTFSVWESIEQLEHFVFKTVHTDFLKRRREWFQNYGKMHTAMWWVQAGNIPSLQEALEKLEYIQNNGPSESAFNFKQKFSAPVSSI